MIFKKGNTKKSKITEEKKEEIHSGFNSIRQKLRRVKAKQNYDENLANKDKQNINKVKRDNSMKKLKQRKISKTSMCSAMDEVCKDFIISLYESMLLRIDPKVSFL